MNGKCPTCGQTNKRPWPPPKPVAKYNSEAHRHDCYRCGESTTLSLAWCQKCIDEEYERMKEYPPLARERM